MNLYLTLTMILYCYDNDCDNDFGDNVDNKDK
jgi:hypothetical protein